MFTPAYHLSFLIQLLSSLGYSVSYLRFPTLHISKNSVRAWFTWSFFSYIKELCK